MPGFGPDAGAQQGAAEGTSPESTPGGRKRIASVPITGPGAGPVAAPDAAVPATSPPPDAAVPPSSPPPDAAPAAPRPMADASMPAPAALKIVRAKDVLVDRIKVGVLYAEQIEVRDARIGRTATSPEERRWEQGGSERKIEGEEIVADVLYAKDVKCQTLEASEVFAKKVKTGR